MYREPAGVALCAAETVVDALLLRIQRYNTPVCTTDFAFTSQEDPHAVFGAIPERRKRILILVQILSVRQIFTCHVGETALTP